MEHAGLLRDLIVLFGTAMLIAALMRKAKQPVIVGYLLTGVLVGPYGLGLVSQPEAVELMADVGVALLLFTIGIELSLKKMARMRQLVLGAASLQLVVTVAAGWLVLILWGLFWRESLFWGFLISTSSTAIVLKMLHDRGEMDTAHGRVILGIQLFQDLCAVPMMAMLPVLAAPGATQAAGILWALAKALAVVGVILVGAYYLFPPLLRAIVMTRSRELLVLAAIFFAMGTAWGASQFGLSLALGAFLAGIVLSESEYGHQLMSDILPFRDSFATLFFVAVGMLINLRVAADNAWLLAGIAGALVVGKLLTGGLPVLLLGFPMRMAALVGVALAQVGEFAFVLLREGARLEMIPEHRYQLFLAAAVLTMIATPPLMALGPRLSAWLGGRASRRSQLALDEETEQLRGHIVICGFGLNGRRMARLLRENDLPYVVVDMNPRMVRSARALGEPIYYGDVSNLEILRASGVAHARGVVFAISDAAILPRAISNARRCNPDAHIIARTKRVEEIRELRLSGATDVVSEELEAWMEIAVRVLRLYGMPREVVAEKLHEMRGDDYAMARILPIPGQPIRHLAHLLPEVDLELFIVVPDSPLEGVELRALELRQRTGAAVLAVLRGEQVVHNPPGDFAFRGGDQILLMGSRRQLGAAFALLTEPGAALDHVPDSGAS